VVVVTYCTFIFSRRVFINEIFFQYPTGVLVFNDKSFFHIITSTYTFHLVGNLYCVVYVDVVWFREPKG